MGKRAQSHELQPEPALHRAARVGDHDTIRRLIASGTPVDALADVGTGERVKPLLATPLMVAAGSAEGASADTVRLLLELGAAIDPGADGSPLSFACLGLQHHEPGGDAERVVALLAAGADPNGVSYYGSPAVACAAERGDPACVRLLLQAGADPMRVGTQKRVSYVALEHAVRAGSEECVRLLLDAGASADDDRTFQPLITRVPSLAILDLLVAAGSDPFVELDHSQSVVGTLSRQRVSVPERAAMLRRLAELGVDLDTGPLVRPIWSAACDGNADGVEALLLAGADPLLAPNALGGACWDDWDDPAHPGIHRTIDLLVAAGCDVHHRDANGLTPMHGALMPYNHGAEYQSSDGVSAPAVAALLRHGASIDIAFWEGLRPLHMAAGNRCPGAVEVLLAAGADPRERADNGRTPLDSARHRLEQAQKPPDEALYRGMYKNKTDAEIAEHIERSLEFARTYNIPNVLRCIDLLIAVGG